jgi:hypothetical protein
MPEAMEEDIPTTATGDPYVWDENALPPIETRNLWKEVAKGIDKSQTGEFTLAHGAAVILPTVVCLVSVRRYCTSLYRA